MRGGDFHIAALVRGGADRSAMWDQNGEGVAVQRGGVVGGGDIVEGLAHARVEPVFRCGRGVIGNQVAATAWRLWLDVEDAFMLLPDGTITLSDDTEAGKRLGFCLEAAALLAEIGRELRGK